MKANIKTQPVTPTTFCRECGDPTCACGGNICWWCFSGLADIFSSTDEELQ